jgi:hypothetical protein
MTFLQPNLNKNKTQVPPKRKAIVLCLSMNIMPSAATLAVLVEVLVVFPGALGG